MAARRAGERSLLHTGVKSVVIAGGTHGNESNGACLAQLFQQRPSLLARSSFAARAIISNPRAVAAGTRYVETDLNRFPCRVPRAAHSALSRYLFLIYLFKMLWRP
jgi:succinylglutamate desuccinylase